MANRNDASESSQLLEELISIGNTDAKIVLITNASMVNYGNKNIIELIKKFKRLVIMLSVDGIGPHTNG